jgi:predicted RNA methylase
MRRHETPLAIAYALARHGPRRAARILDPAVGNGVLLEPFFGRSGGGGFEAFAVDSDSRPLKRVRLRLNSGAGRVLKVIQADFLEWACRYGKRRGELFDCVVMNPPFAGRRRRWRSLVGLGKLLGLSSLPETGPVEAGFVLGAVALLRPGGRLLAVLPASLMTAPSTGWVRGFLAGTGAIRHVHELPRFAFPEIESRIYLVVYEKGGQRRETLLLNHDLKEPEKLVMAGRAAAGAERLDFGYHSARARFGALRKRASLGWCRLGELATVWRGTEKTPGIAESVVHTGNHVGGFWQSDRVRSLKGGAVADGQIRPGDILVRRVSRNCARSFGLGIGIRGALVSDCVLIARPRYRVGSTRLLFAIRCLMALDFGPGLLERGTGASYLAQGELGGLEVPYGLSRVCRALFGLYRRAVRCRCFEAMQGVESRAVRKLLRADGGEA